MVQQEPDNAQTAFGDDDGVAWQVFTNKYFNTDGFVNQTTLGFQDGQVTRYDLMDQAGVLRDYTILLKGWQESGFSWVNKDDFIKVEYTTNFTHEVTTIEFAENQLPEPAPMETPPRYLTISKNTVIETSKNYNLGFPFNNRQMATAAGQEEFGWFSARVTQMFIELVSRLSLVKLFQRSPVDEMYYNPSEGISRQQLERLLEDEVIVTFVGNLSSFGCLPAMLEAATRMEKVNPGGGKPDKVLFNSEKQLLLKFGVESAARGTNLLSTDDFIHIYGMDFRAVPHFSTSTTKADLDVGSLLSTRMEIGNHFPMENLMLDFATEKVSIAQQGRISLFSENANGMQDVRMTECNIADPRWDKSGSLKANHDGIKTDMYTYYVGDNTPDDEDSFVRCRVIGDMKAEDVDDNYIRKTVALLLRRMPVDQLNLDLEVFQAGPVATTDPVYRRMKTLASRMMVILGGQKNPLFRPSASTRDPKANEDSATFALRQMMFNIFKIDMDTRAPAPPGGLAPASQGLGFNSKRGDNEMQTDGKYLGSDLNIDLLHSIDGLLGDIVRVCNLMAKTAVSRIVTLMRSHLQVYMTAYQSDLSAGDFEWIHRALTAFCNAVEHTDMDTNQALAKINSIQYVITQLQALGRGKISVIQLESMIDNADSLLRDDPCPLDLLPGMPDQERERDADPENVYSGIVDFTDGKASGYKRRVQHDEGSPMEPEDMVNIWRSVGRINNLFYSPIEIGVGMILMLVPIHRDVYQSMMENDVFVPAKWIIIRNQMTYESEGCCLTQSGSGGLGNAFLSYPAAEIGKTAMDMTGMIHVAQCVSIVIPDPKKRWMIPNLFYRRALGGANHKFYTTESWDKHVRAGYFSKGYNRDSLTSLSVPLWTRIPDELHVSGFYHPDEDIPHYPTASYYRKELGYNKFSYDSVCLHQRTTSQDANGLCYKGTYATYGEDGKHNGAFENMGHHKVERVGDKILRQRGDTVRDSQAAAMFQY